VAANVNAAGSPLSRLKPIFELQLSRSTVTKNSCPEAWLPSKLMMMPWPVTKGQSLELLRQKRR